MLGIIFMYSAVGAVAGVLAGLFGIGGGIVIVPMLVYCLTLQGVSPEVMMQIALGTSMASIMFTAVSSFMAHHRRGAVVWDIVRRITPGILIGTFLASLVASHMPKAFLQGFFVLFLYYVAAQMILGKKPKPTRELPGRAGMFGAGGIIGVVSSFVGIGGGSLSVPFMLWHNVSVHKAIGTSAAIGFPIAVAGTIGYITGGAGHASLPPYSLGYVYLPALAGIVALSVLTAPFGVRLAHSLPVDRLKRIFAVVLMVVATRMLIGLF
jgi:uncharacterized membrane protein YfcA